MDKESRRRRRNTVVALAVGWTVVILALCSIPGGDLPEVRIMSADKIAHFAMFAAFGWLWMLALPGHARHRFGLVVAAGIAYAVFTEIYQGIIPLSREPDMWDVVANTAGLLVGAGLHLFRHTPRTATEAT